MIKRSYIMAAMMVTLAAGCSVKESREGCPCRMVMEFTEVDTVAGKDVRLYVDDGKELVCDVELDAGDFFPEYSASVPRTQLYVNVYDGDDGFLKHGEGIRIPASRINSKESSITKSSKIMGKGTFSLEAKIEKSSSVGKSSW